MLGFSYNGKHCSKFGICMKSKNRSLMPQPKIYTEEVMDRDGVYDFSAANPLGRVLYKNREIIVECAYVSDSFSNVRNNAHEIAFWLFSGSKQLIFDDEPFYYYIATLREKVDMSHVGRRGSFTLIFDCEPFAYYINSTTFTFSCTEASNTFYVNNPGFVVQPVLRLQGPFTNPVIKVNSGIMKYNGTADGILEIDSENKTATLGGTNVLPLMSGEFFKLDNFRNIITVTADEINATLYVYFREKYL